MFTIIGERINMTREPIKEAVAEEDEDFIAAEARKQEEAGGTHIDVNAGGNPDKEVENMRWLVEVTAEATDLPLVFDSSNPEAIGRGLELCHRPGSIVNSITAEQERLVEVLVSARAVMGLDDYCMEYLQTFRGNGQCTTGVIC